ncbi:HpcH/HpaI aldolase/citrate lyase family protein [Bordetella hinzii]|uniref:HpcH/HpaI aldolase/citrate lyase family protein n=1 Tax=Bordetella hinzii OH87 BAL007II TaxID=1331262 RepID=A0ABR4R1I4_9BORD|nr:CoA ester lyase [Bordetella hinzii]KCB23806.1 HpcH/HpaI aldolase/citrate lyase family protein [Bordetella hinzii OH87 BAL007II]KCB42432.1 HpcH/HpaI aldolase/citrate lyase family protein [Bordetella hinzii 5132]QDJ42154.1 CoA ester lyase [Bordetella hinzii]QWF37588.1 CoA ester lyase [Bordetella hinzii]QWF42132.1 CoA ester lyase [Bordetella hinzii]
MQIKELRSLLFLPANRPAFIERAHERSADAVILDLEDAVLPEQKAEARLMVPRASAALAARGLTVLLRVNADPQAWCADLDAADLSKLKGVILPKVEAVAEVAALAEALNVMERRSACPWPLAVAALIESPLGVLRAAEIAQASERLCALGFGAEDYAACLGIPPEPDYLRWPAQQVANSARAFGLGCWGLADTVANMEDMARFEGAVREARNLGFTGSVAVHPRQVPPVNRGFSPTQAELEWALRVVAAAEAGRAQGKGVVRLDGRMVDQPLVDRAERWLRQRRMSQ